MVLRSFLIEAYTNVPFRPKGPCRIRLTVAKVTSIQGVVWSQENQSFSLREGWDVLKGTSIWNIKMIHLTNMIMKTERGILVSRIRGWKLCPLFTWVLQKRETFWCFQSSLFIVPVPDRKTFLTAQVPRPPNLTFVCISGWQGGCCILDVTGWCSPL